ncbi:MAG: hypothetical protein V7700_13565, partial [Halioglobus sp.]
ADSRFQEELLQQAKLAGKIEDDYEIPLQYRNNLPQRLQEVVTRLKSEQQSQDTSSQLFPKFPFGTDFTPEELVLTDVLQKLKFKMSSRRTLFKALAGAVGAATSPVEAASPYLARMGLDKPRDLKETAIQKLILSELKDSGYV